MSAAGALEEGIALLQSLLAPPARLPGLGWKTRPSPREQSQMGISRTLHPSRSLQPQTHHLSVLDAPRIGPGGSGRGPRIPLLVSAVHVLLASCPSLGLTLLRILPYSHNGEWGRRGRKSTRCQRPEPSGNERGFQSSEGVYSLAPLLPSPGLSFFL